MAKTRTSEASNERHRMLASVSFVAVLIVVGIPLWWKTTEVHRVALPYDEIEELARAPVRVGVKISVLANDEPTAAEVAGLLRQLLASDLVKPAVSAAVLSDELRVALTAASDDEEAAALLGAAHPPDADVRVVQRSRLAAGVWLGDDSVLLFKDASAGSTVAAVLREWVLQTRVLESAGGGARDNHDVTVGADKRLPARDHYDIMLTIAHPAPHQYELHFPAQEALEDYIGTFVDELSFLHNFTLRSQWVHLLEVDFKAEKTGARHLVRRARLPHALSPLETRSGARTGPHTPVRLLLYALPCQLSPLFIVDDDGEIIAGPISGFMSPRWGGVVLASPDESSCVADESQRRPFAPSVPLVMGTFLAQLRELLGITQLRGVADATLAPLRSVRARRWELTALARLRTLEHYTSAVRTLTSIAQLLGEIPNIVINDEVGAALRSAVAAAQRARTSAAEGETREAHAHAQRAWLAAERAFTSPSLLALLYFPDDQKYAVYIPLFLPVMLPVIISLKNIWAWLRGRHNKEKAD